MADENPVRYYLTHTLGIPAAASRAITDEGLEQFEDLVNMSDEHVQAIIKNARKRFYDAAARGAAAANRPHISDKHATRVRQLVFCCWHLHRIRRDFDEDDATVDELETLWEWRENEQDAGKLDVDKPGKMTSTTQARKTMEELDHYLLCKRGVNGTPLAYLVRDDPEPDEDDEGYGLPSITEELIRRARHGNNYPPYVTDNTFLWSVIREITQDGEAWSWVSSFSRTRNGRGAYLALKAHYLGPSFNGKVKADADHVIEKAFYNGKARNFTLEAYCSKLKKAFDDLETCGEVLSENRKVRYFIRGISGATQLAVAKGQILASDEMKEDLEMAMNFAKTYESSLDSYGAPSRNISTTDTRGGRGRGGGGRGRGRGGRGRGGGGRGGGRGGGGRGDKTKYLSGKEWSKLSAEEQAAIRAARDAAGIGNKKRKVEVLDTVTEGAGAGTAGAAAGAAAGGGVGNNMTRR